MPAQVRLVEVGPRDGLQNETAAVATAVKLALIRRLAAAGLQSIEATSFVAPKWVPQMADADAVMTALRDDDAATYLALTPNLRGFERAMQCGVREVAVFAAASESFSQRNINCSIAASLARFEPILAAARQADVRVRGYVSCAIDCPYQGAVAAADVAAVAAGLYQMGCYEISLGDTIGSGTPGRVLTMLDAVAGVVPPAALAAHFHDTYGQALANIYAALQWGIGVIDCAVGGLGGCPYAPGAAGNVASEDVVYLLDGLGIHHGVNAEALAATGAWITGELGRPNRARAGGAGRCRENRQQ